MKKKWLLLLNVLLVLALVFSGCGLQSEKGKKGRFVEQSISFPDGDFVALSETAEGKILYAVWCEDQFKIYSLAEDYSWSEEKMMGDIEQEGLEGVMRFEVDDNGLTYLYRNAQDEVLVGETTYDGKNSSLALSDESGPYKLPSQNYFRFAKTAKGDYIIQDTWAGPLRSFDGKSGKVKNTYSQQALSFVVSGDELILNNGWNDPYIASYDIETGNQLSSVAYDIQDNNNNISYDEKSIYLFNNKGIQVIKEGSSTWEQIVEPDNNSFSQGNVNIYNSYILSDGSYLMCTMEQDSMQLLRYYYDPEASNTYEKEVTVFMGYNIDPIKKAISIYGKQHPEIKINIKTMDQNVSFNEAVDGLNTEILAGGGPDMLVLDSLPIQTYIDKGVLADLSDIGQSYIDEKQGYSNIVNTYKQNDKLYAIPLRFKVPMVWGEEAVLKNGASLENLVAYKEAHPDEIVFNKNMIGLSRQFSSIIQPALVNDQGAYDREKTISYIEAIKALGEDVNNEIDYERIDCEPAKYLELLDVAEHKAAVTLLEPRNVGDIACADAILDARGDGTVAPLMINGQIIYETVGIMGINANSKNQEIIKEIINIALSDEVQKDVCWLGVPPSAHDAELQEAFLQYYESELSDDTGRSIPVDNEISKTYDICKDSWTKASLCCNTTMNLPYVASSIIEQSVKEQKDINALLDDFEAQQELQTDN